MSEAKINEKGILPILMDEIDGFEKEVEKFVQGEWDPNAFMAFRLKQGVYGQRQPGLPDASSEDTHWRSGRGPA